MSDTILREDVKNAINATLAESIECEHSAIEALNLLCHEIMALPTAEKTGHWENGENNIGMKRYVCSICGKGQPYLRFNYCPNCGADMRENEQEYCGGGIGRR